MLAPIEVNQEKNIISFKKNGFYNVNSNGIKELKWYMDVERIELPEGYWSIDYLGQEFPKEEKRK